MSRLTKEDIEKFRSVYARYFSDKARINEVCDLALQSLSLESVRSEALDTKMVDLLIDATWRKCVGQCMADNCGRLFISRERFDEHIAPLIRALQSPARVAEGGDVSEARHILVDAERPCTCHPDDNPPVPCPKKYALTECRKAAPESPAKEQPGEQIAAPQAAEQRSWNLEPGSGPAVAAKDKP